jgi:hypothetical protein
MKEALGSSETSVLTRATWHNIPEDTILHVYLLRTNKQTTLDAYGECTLRFPKYYVKRQATSTPSVDDKSFLQKTKVDYGRVSTKSEHKYIFISLKQVPLRSYIAFLWRYGGFLLLSSILFTSPTPVRYISIFPISSLSGVLGPQQQQPEVLRQN